MSARVFTGRALPFVIAVAFAAAASGAAAAVGAPSSARPSVLYDAIGDGGGLPEITSVAVARDKRDRLTFAVNVANRSAPRKGEALSIGIDSDLRADTGDNGVDVVLSLGWWASDTDPTYAVERWDGSEWQTLDTSALVTHPTTGFTSWSPGARSASAGASASRRVPGGSRARTSGSTERPTSGSRGSRCGTRPRSPRSSG